MIQKWIEGSIRNRGLILCLFVLVALASLFSLKTAKIDAIPDIGENQQIVFTEWPGRSPKDIEKQITYPLSVILQGLPGVKSLRGMSAFGFSTIYVIFKDKIDYHWSRSRVLEKLSVASSELPKDVVPKMGPDATGLGQIYWYTIDNDPEAKKPKSLAELRSIQDFYVRYLLQGVEGVSEVASVGGFVKEYQIDVDPKKLFAFDIHFSALLSAIKESNIDVGAEVIEEGDREFVVRGKGFFKDLSDIQNTVIAVKNGTPIRIKDVARVGVGPAFRRGALDRNGLEAVGGVVAMRFGENPKEVISKLKARLKVIEAGLPKGVSIQPFYDRTELIESTIGTVYRALSEAMLITVVVILLFLLHFRSSLLVSLTLPFGVGISFIFMKLLNIDSNVMSLSGLVISVGSMVDMGLIMTENIYSKLADSSGKNRKHRVQLIIDSAKEVGPAILIAALTTILSFLPVFALEEAEGKLFIPLAWAKTLAMFGSLIVAITLIPALSVFFLKGNLKPIRKNFVSRSILRGYRPLLSFVLEHRFLFLLAPILLVLAGAWAFTQIGREFMPSLNEGDLLYMPVTTQDISMTKARELLGYTDKILHDHPLVEYAVGKLGRVESALDPAPISMFETIIKLIPKNQFPKGTDIHDIIQDLDSKLQIPGLVNSWDFPIQTRMAMISTGIKTQVGIKIFGDDLKTLERLAAKVGKEVTKIKGASDVYAEQITAKPYIEFDVDRFSASRFGINTGTVNAILQTAVGGMPIGEFYDGRERYPIRVRYKKEFRDRIDDLKKVLVPSPLGQHIPLKQLADIQVLTGPAVIQSENAMLRSVVQLNVKGRDVVGFVKEAKQKIKKNLQLPRGYSIVWAGQYENQVRANLKLLLLIPITLLINLFILFIGLKSIHKAAIVFSTVPVAFSGGLLFLWLFGFNASVAVWVGFIVLFGIAVDDAVVMMTYLQVAVRNRAAKDWNELKSAILEAGSRRIRPLFMTTTTTIAALFPVLWSQTTGSEVMKPMAIPILGGMIVEFITLFVIPVVFSLVQENRLKLKKSF